MVISLFLIRGTIAKLLISLRLLKKCFGEAYPEYQILAKKSSHSSIFCCPPGDGLKSLSIFQRLDGSGGGIQKTGGELVGALPPQLLVLSYQGGRNGTLFR